MKELIITYLPWLISIFTLLMMWFAGNKSPKAWVIGLGNQVLWLTWIITSQTWGLLLLTGALIVMYIRNFIKWQQ